MGNAFKEIIFMKIAIFHCAFIYTGGGERIVLGQYDQLVKNGHQVSIWTPVLDKANCYPDIIDRYPIQTFLPQLPTWFPFRHAITLLATCLLAPFFSRIFSDFDVILGENQPGIWLAFCISRIIKKPYIAYLCHPNKMVYPRPFINKEQLWQAVRDFYLLSWLVDGTKPLIGWLDRISVQGARRVLVNGFLIGSEIEKIYKVDWIGCPCGVSFDQLVLEESGMGGFLQNNDRLSGSVSFGEWCLKKPYILFTGRHEVWKRLDMAIRAFALVKADYPSLSLVIPGPFTKHTITLQRLAKDVGMADSVLFIGSVSQSRLALLYRQAAVYVFPSTLEDFGIAILEAMAFGTPVVAWRAGGPIDSVVDGETGYLARPYRIDHFAALIKELLADPARLSTLSSNCTMHTKKNFSWVKHLEILEKALQEGLQ